MSTTNEPTKIKLKAGVPTEIGNYTVTAQVDGELEYSFSEPIGARHVMTHNKETMTKPELTLMEMIIIRYDLNQLLTMIEKTGTQSTTTSGADFYAEVIVLREELQKKINEEVTKKL